MIVNLPRKAVVCVDLDRQQRCRVQCREGRIWITRTGDSRDFFLQAGQEHVFTGSGKMVVEAVRVACVGIFGESTLSVTVTEEVPSEDHHHHWHWVNRMRRMLELLRRSALLHGKMRMTYSEPGR